MDDNVRAARIAAAVIPASIETLAAWEQRFDEYARRFAPGKNPDRQVTLLYPYKYELGPDYWQMDVYLDVARGRPGALTRIMGPLHLVRRQHGETEVTRAVFEGPTSSLVSYTVKVPLATSGPNQPRTLVISLLAYRYNKIGQFEIENADDCNYLGDDAQCDLDYLWDAAIH